MSVSTGRMSRAAAQDTLRKAIPAISEFLSPDASPATLAEATELRAIWSELQTQLDHGYGPHAEATRDLRTRLAALQYARLLNSSTTPPRISQAVAVTLYGEDDRILSTQGAADLAAKQLGLPGPDYVRLQDCSHVRTATLTGTRYIFTSQHP